MQYTILSFSYHRKHHFLSKIFDFTTKIQFDYEISRHTKVLRHAGWECLICVMKGNKDYKSAFTIQRLISVHNFHFRYRIR
jgi:hypothetical protein